MQILTARWIRLHPEDYVFDFSSSSVWLSILRLVQVARIGWSVQREGDVQFGSCFLIYANNVQRLLLDMVKDTELLLKHSSSLMKHIPGHCKFEHCTQMPFQKHQTCMLCLIQFGVFKLEVCSCLLSLSRDSAFNLMIQMLPSTCQLISSCSLSLCSGLHLPYQHLLLILSHRNRWNRLHIGMGRSRIDLPDRQ